MKGYLQRMGQSLMLPVATLPAAALLIGISSYLSKGWVVANFMNQGGQLIMNNLALLFAVGLAVGMAEERDGSAAIAGLVAFLIPANILSPKTLATILNVPQSHLNPAFAVIPTNVLIGICAGLIAAALYNRFHEVKLPTFLSFFSGKRLVPILAAFVMLVFSAIMYFIWPAIYDALVWFAQSISGLGFIGAGLYGLFNRLLIPTGLHHALNSVFWFNVAGINDIGNYWAGKGIKGITGMYQAGFFPVMMFGLPAGAYAIYRQARPERKKETGSLMLASGFSAFFVGVTEPLEFSFMFSAWPLYVLHAILTGLLLGFAALMHWTAGFSFSAGLMDFVLGARVPMANFPYMLLVQGVIMAGIYYFSFTFAIQKFDLKTPGREPIAEASDSAVDAGVVATDDKYLKQAKQIYAAIGGQDNIKVIGNCTTRLRLQLNDTSLVDQAAVKAAHVPGLNVLDEHNIHIVIGTDVQFVAEDLQQLYDGKLTATATPAMAYAGAAADTPTNQVQAEMPASPAIDTTTVFHAPATGKLMPISDVADDTFAQKMLGDGFAVEPTDGEIVSPVSGEVTSVFPTKHAIGLKTADGLEILLHMGINTVELNGAPFTLHVEAGDQIAAGSAVATVDLAAIKAAGKATTMMVVLTNMDHVQKFDLNPSQTVTAGEMVGASVSRD